MEWPERQETLLRIALAENARLLEENARLKKLLADHGLAESRPGPPGNAVPPAPTGPGAEKQAQEHRKIALFRSLFRGREDVYATRWQGRDGRTGYSPAAIQDWDALMQCAPDQRKRIGRQTRKLLPLTDETIRDHLTGKRT